MQEESGINIASGLGGQTSDLKNVGGEKSMGDGVKKTESGLLIASAGSNPRDQLRAAEGQNRAIPDREKIIVPRGLGVDSDKRQAENTTLPTIAEKEADEARTASTMEEQAKRQSERDEVVKLGKELKGRYEGKTTAEAEASMIEDEMANGESEKTARDKTKRFFTVIATTLGEDFGESLKASDFNTFMDNFFKYSEGYSSSVGRWGQSRKEGKNGDFISFEETQNHLKYKDKFFAFLKETYTPRNQASGLVPIDSSALSHLLTKDQRDVTVDDLYNIIARLQTDILADEGLKRGVKKNIEHAFAVGMNKDKDSVVDERIYYLIEDWAKNKPKFERFCKEQMQGMNKTPEKKDEQKAA